MARYLRSALVATAPHRDDVKKSALPTENQTDRDHCFAITTRTYIIEHAFSCVNKETRYGLLPGRRGPGSDAQDHPHHTREIVVVDLAQIPFRVAAPQQLGGETREVGPASHAREGELAQTAAGIPDRDLLGSSHRHDLVIEVAADTHMVDSDQPDDVIDVICPARNRRLAVSDVAGHRHHADQSSGRRDRLDHRVSEVAGMVPDGADI